MCGKQFKSQKILTQHNRVVHIEEDIPCSLCDKTFRTKKHLANHKFSKHTEKESLQCDVKSDLKTIKIKKQNNIDCIYMTNISAVFSHFHFSDVSSLLKKSVGECFC